MDSDGGLPLAPLPAVDVSGDPYIDLEREAAAMFARE